ncbi:MAG: hypothetical protein J7L23_00425 [Candidatus Diapherotrites archaeon]|nr:hypothetical protein [Candidatus Diapherotrites archaeon]
MPSMLELVSEEKSQSSLEYLYLTAFAVGIVAVVAILLNDILSIQERAKNKVIAYKEDVFRMINVTG